MKTMKMKVRSFLRLYVSSTLGLLFLLWTASCTPAPVVEDGEEAAVPVVAPYPESDEGRTVVVWMSMDGMRHDYLDRTDTPNFDRLIREGAHTRELNPGFPSLTFPAHTSQATGVKVEEHGVPSNTFYDSIRDREFRFAGFADLLQAEPIWTTAARQNVRAAVYDWIMSYNQEGPHAAEYFGERYAGDVTDRERMELILNSWIGDAAEEPLRLMMGYSVTPDKAGHEYGPDAPEIADAVSEMDELYGWFTEQLIEIFDKRMSPRDELYLLITTDHGMSEVHSLVHIRRLAGIEEVEDVVTVTSGNIGHIFLHKIEPEKERTGVEQNILDRLAKYDFAKVGRRDELPERWGYNHPTRVGDIVVVLDTGYTFAWGVESDVEPVEDHGGPLGMHGYDPEDNPDMLGLGIIWRYPEPLGGTYLGPVHSLQLHPTVARILGIDPAEGATHEALDLELPLAAEPWAEENP